MNITQRDRVLGTGYGMKPSTTGTELTSIGRGTPMGELLRHYWQPVDLTGDATDIPRKVRVPREHLVLFRDRPGRAALLHARRCHRTTFCYGRLRKTASAAATHAAHGTQSAGCTIRSRRVDRPDLADRRYVLSHSGDFRRYVLSLLTVVYALNLLDRNSLLGIPIARLAVDHC